MAGSTTCPQCGTTNDPGADICFTCGRALQVLTKGAIVAGRYEVLSMLGRGGMGAVYKAKDKTLDEIVALKVLRAEYAGDADLQRRFLQEIKLARKISHRNVCRIHEYGDDNGLRYISMAFVDGVDLKRILRDGPMPPADAFDAMIQVSEGLAAIHDEGIIHRDLKTPNIHRDTKGVVRLLDFGIAKEWQAKTAEGLTATGMVVGTPEYLSPEQVRAKPLDFRSDLYALGIVTFEVFTGRVPFTGDTTAAILQQHLTQPPPLTGPEAARVPRSVVPILRRALAKEPQLRHGSALEFADALREAARDSDAISTVVPGAGAEPAGAGWAPTQARPGAGTPRPSAPTPRPGAITPRPGTTPRTGSSRPVRTTVRQRPSAPEPEPSSGRGLWLGLAAVVVLGSGGAFVVFRSEPSALPPPTQAAAPAAAVDAPAPAGPMPAREATTPAVAPSLEPMAAATAPVIPAATQAPTVPPTEAPTEEPRDAASQLQEDCDRGRTGACADLGRRYEAGEGVRQDIDRAVRLYERGCDRGGYTACDALGHLYMRGQGVRQDPEKATSLFKTACEGGVRSSCEGLEELKSRAPGGQDGRRPPMGGPPPGPRR